MHPGYNAFSHFNTGRHKSHTPDNITNACPKRHYINKCPHTDNNTDLHENPSQYAHS